MNHKWIIDYWMNYQPCLQTYMSQKTIFSCLDVCLIFPSFPGVRCQRWQRYDVYIFVSFFSVEMLIKDLDIFSAVISLLQGPESKHGGRWERRGERGDFNFYKKDISSTETLLGLNTSSEASGNKMSGKGALNVTNCLCAKKIKTSNIISGN